MFAFSLRLESLHLPLNKLIGYNTASRVDYDRHAIQTQLEWVYTSEFQKRLNHYLGNMVRDYTSPVCNELSLFFPANGAFQKGQLSYMLQS